MRFGLVGAGPWAELAHGPGLASAPHVELVGVWARRPERAMAVADRFGGSAYDDYRALLADVDAVAFSVPPDIQAAMALDAARAGKHLLLDKPVATTVDAAEALVAATADAGVASVVFFTDRFVPATRAWFAETIDTGGWHGGWVRWFSALQQPDNPFGASPWRRERGALWDTGPHALSSLTAVLGPVRELRAVGGAGDLVTLVLRHESGASSSIELTQFAPPAATLETTVLWGEHGFTTMPPRPAGGEGGVLAEAAEQLVAAATGGPTHPVDVRLGADIVALLAAAEAQLAGS